MFKIIASIRILKGEIKTYPYFLGGISGDGFDYISDIRAAKWPQQKIDCTYTALTGQLPIAVSITAIAFSAAINAIQRPRDVPLVDSFSRLLKWSNYPNKYKQGTR